MKETLFVSAHPYQKDVLALPVIDLKVAAWYVQAFSLAEVQRQLEPVPTIILQRDGVQIGFAVNGNDASQDGVAIRVTDIHRAHEELKGSGARVGDLQIDERDGEKYHAFFVVAPDGLCFYFHQLLSE